VALIGFALGLAAARPLWSDAPTTAIRNGFIYDDAFFYVVTARNWLKTGVPSLDGLTETNGFQPLWFWIQAALQRIYPRVADIRLLLVATSLCVGMAAALAAVRLGRTARPLAAAALFVLAVFAQPGSHTLWLTGLETALATALAATLMFRGPALLTGTLLGLLVLARLDLAAFAPAVVLAAVPPRDYTNDSPAPAPRALTIAEVVAPAMALVGPWLFFTWRKTGSVVPISGRVKSYLMHESLPTLSAYMGSDEWLGITGTVGRLFGIDIAAHRAGLVVLTLGLLVAGIGTARQLAKADPAWRPLAALVTVGVPSHMALMYLGHRELRPYSAYYFAPDVFLVAVALVAAAMSHRLPILAELGLVRRLGRRVAITLGVLLLVWNATANHHEPKPSPYWQARATLAAQIATSVPADEPIGAYWPGYFAWALPNTILPLDGVIADDTWFESTVKPGHELAEVHERGTLFIVAWLPIDYPNGTPPAAEKIAAWHERPLRQLYAAREHYRVLFKQPIQYAPDVAPTHAWMFLALKPGHLPDRPATALP
jgi:hypothetical protein